MTDQAGFPVIGLGAIASIGATAAEIYANLCAGVSGLAPMRGFNHAWYNSPVLFEIDDRGGRPDVPKRATRWLLDAIGQALADAGLPERLGDIPVLIGTGLREVRSVELWYRDGADFAADDLHFGPELRRRFGAVNTHTISNACCASLYTLALATDLLRTGEADTVVVAGTDSIGEAMVGVADRVQVPPPDTVRPFDANRRGTIQGEGAAAVVLRRVAGPGDRVHGWVRGVGINCDANHPTAPDRESIVGVVRDAHRRAGVTPADIDLVMLHGTGTFTNDRTEAECLTEVFGPHRGTPVMTTLKSMTGHTSGTSGLHSLITALYGMREGWIPPVSTLDEPMAEATGLRLIRQRPVRARVRLAQVNAFGFGGINAVAIVAAPAVQSSAVQSSAVQSSAVQSSAVQSPAVQSPAVQSPAVQSPSDTTVQLEER